MELNHQILDTLRFIDMLQDLSRQLKTHGALPKSEIRTTKEYLSIIYDDEKDSYNSNTPIHQYPIISPKYNKKYTNLYFDVAWSNSTEDYYVLIYDDSGTFNIIVDKFGWDIESSDDMDYIANDLF